MQERTKSARVWLVIAGTVLLVGLLGGCGLASGGGGEGEVTLRLSHQWPGVNEEGEGDFRSVIAKRFANQVNERTDGEVTVQIYPNNSLIEDPIQQYQAITQGTTDMSVYPLTYAVGDVREFELTSMPALIKNHAQAQNWENAEIGDEFENVVEENELKVLTWNWNSAALGVAEGPPAVSPKDIERGDVWRGISPPIEAVLENQGAGIASMSSSELYSALQTGTVDAVATSPSSFSSYNLEEQLSSYTAPGEDGSLTFIFEPLVIGMDQFEELTPEQQQVFEEVGAELQDYAYEASEEDDERVEREFEEAGVEVVEMDGESFAEWQDVSEPIWENFAQEVEGGQEMIDLAREVPEN